MSQAKKTLSYAIFLSTQSINWRERERGKREQKMYKENKRQDKQANQTAVNKKKKKR